MIHLKSRNINRIFVISLRNGEGDPTRSSINKYYMLLVEIKDFSALIGNKPIFDQLVEKQEVHEKLAEMSRNNDYTTRNLLDYSYHQNYYKFIGIDLSKQTNTFIHQQINFTGKLEENDGNVFCF